VCYHGNEVVALNNLPDLPHFILNIARPDLTDYLTGICKCGWHVGRSGEALKSQQSCSARGGVEGRGGGASTVNKLTLLEEEKKISVNAFKSLKTTKKRKRPADHIKNKAEDTKELKLHLTSRLYINLHLLYPRNVL